jgi:hypothetical protein
MESGRRYRTTYAYFVQLEPSRKALHTFLAVIPLDPFSGDVLAYTTSVSATGALVILYSDLQVRHHCMIKKVDTDQNLFPSSIQPPSFFVAFSFIETTSEPAPGSDIARAPICSLVNRLERQREYLKTQSTTHLLSRDEQR